jgi:hypothetical protein
MGRAFIPSLLTKHASDLIIRIKKSGMMNWWGR